MISIDIYWHLLTSIDIYWHLLTSIDIYWHLCAWTWGRSPKFWQITAGLRLERVGCDESLGGGKGGKHGWFMVYPFSYHGLPLKIASNLWLSRGPPCFFFKYFDWPITCHRKKHETLLNAMPSCTRCQDTSGVQHSQTSRLHVHQCPWKLMATALWPHMATYGHQIWGKQGVTVHMSIHIWYLGYLKCDPTG